MIIYLQLKLIQFEIVLFFANFKLLGVFVVYIPTVKFTVQEF